MVESNPGKDSTRDFVLEDMLERTKNALYISKNRKKPLDIKKLTRIVNPYDRYSELVQYNASTKDLTIKYVYLFAPPIIGELFPVTKDKTAPFAPVFLNNDYTGIKTMNAQGMSFWEAMTEARAAAGDNIVGIELVLKGKKLVDFESSSDGLKASKIITNYYTPNGYNNFDDRSTILFFTDPEEEEGYEMVTDFTHKSADIDLDDLLESSFKSDSNGELKTRMMEHFKLPRPPADGKSNPGRSLYRFSMEDGIVSKTRMADSMQDTVDVKNTIVEHAHNMMKGATDFQTNISVFLNGYYIDFYTFMDSYRKSYGNIIVEYLKGTKAKEVNGKIKYMGGQSDILYEKDKFMNMIKSLPEENLKVIRKNLSVHDNRSGYGDLYG